MKRSMAVALSATLAAGPLFAQTGVTDPVLKHIWAAGQDSSHTKDATVTLPVGMGINPSAANGLQVCTDAQFGKGATHGLRFGCVQRLGQVHRAPCHCEILTRRDDGSERRGVRSGHSLRVIFLQRAGRQARLSHGGHATRNLPLRTNLIRRGGQNSRGVALLIKLARDVGDASKAAHVGLGSVYSRRSSQWRSRRHRRGNHGRWRRRR